MNTNSYTKYKTSDSCHSRESRALLDDESGNPSNNSNHLGIILYIDSTDNKRTICKINEKEFIHEVDSPRDQDVFGFIKSILGKENINPEDIDEIKVNPGPGSFTGTRVGVAIANMLSYALEIKVNGSHTPVEAIYSSPPSITKK